MRTGSWRAAIAGLLVPLLFPALLHAEGPRIVRIGTGGAGGTYYPVGTLIAAGLSDGSIPDLLAVAQTSNGSVSNVEALAQGLIELGLAQANVSAGAFEGRLGAGGSAMTDLRAVANVYVEVMHLVARADLPIGSPADLRGLSVSLDEPGSGTLEDARRVLAAFGVRESDFHPEYVKPDLALRRLLDGRLDAFFIVAGPPVSAIASARGVRLVPVEGPVVRRLVAENPSYQVAVVPGGTYDGQPELRTIGVGAQLITRADMDEDLIYEVTRALWSDDMRRRLENGHSKGREIRLERALEGLAIPLHPGAARYYRESGLLP